MKNDQQLQFSFIEIEESLKDIETYAKVYSKGSTQRAIFAKLGEIKKMMKIKLSEENRAQEIETLKAVAEDLLEAYCELSSQKMEIVHYQECLLGEANG